MKKGRKMTEGRKGTIKEGAFKARSEERKG
jgi:hypothetical protein